MFVWGTAGAMNGLLRLLGIVQVVEVVGWNRGASKVRGILSISSGSVQLYMRSVNEK